MAAWQTEARFPSCKQRDYSECSWHLPVLAVLPTLHVQTIVTCVCCNVPNFEVGADQPTVQMLPEVVLYAICRGCTSQKHTASERVHERTPGKVSTQQCCRKVDCSPTRNMGSLGLPLPGVVNIVDLSYVNLLFNQRQAKAAHNTESIIRQASY